MKEKVERMKRGGVEEVKRTGENRVVSGLDGGGVVVVVWYSVYSRVCTRSSGRELESAGCLESVQRVRVSVYTVYRVTSYGLCFAGLNAYCLLTDSLSIHSIL